MAAWAGNHDGSVGSYHLLFDLLYLEILEYFRALGIFHTFVRFCPEISKMHPSPQVSKATLLKWHSRLELPAELFLGLGPAFRIFGSCWQSFRALAKVIFRIFDIFWCAAFLLELFVRMLADGRHFLNSRNPEPPGEQSSAKLKDVNG